MKLFKLSRVLHRWGSIIALVPMTIIIVSGIALQLKKESIVSIRVSLLATSFLVLFEFPDAFLEGDDSETYHFRSSWTSRTPARLAQAR